MRELSCLVAEFEIRAQGVKAQHVAEQCVATTAAPPNLRQILQISTRDVVAASLRSSYLVWQLLDMPIMRTYRPRQLQMT
jgi:hypothetical protein